MSSHAITVLGHDRPGIIAEVTGALGGLGLNLEDSSMTLLRGHFAMTLICEGSAPTADIEAALAPLRDERLDVTVREVLDEEAAPPVLSTWVLTVHGADRPGIVSEIVAEVARLGGNITDLTTRLTRDLYLLIAEVDLPPGVTGEELEAVVTEAATRVGVRAVLHSAEAGEL